MASICLYFEVHQPIRLNRFSVFHIGNDNTKSTYFDQKLNQEIFQKVAKKCYLPTNNLLLDLNYVEDANAEMDMNVVMLGKGTFVEVQGTAEGSPFSKKQMDKLLDLAREGIKELIAIQKKSLGEIKFKTF